MLTTTEPGNAFPENFSCWYAGALEAKGYGTVLEIINLEKIIQSSSSEPLEIEAERLTALQDTLSMTDKLILVLPEYNNMLPVGLDNFIALIAKHKYKLCKWIAIIMDDSTHQDDDAQSHLLFRYPLHRLDTFFGTTFSANRIQIKNSPTGNMCPLFAASHNDLCRLVQQVLG